MDVFQKQQRLRTRARNNLESGCRAEKTGKEMMGRHGRYMKQFGVKGD